MSLGAGAYKVCGARQCSSTRRRYPWQPCERPPPNRNLLGAWEWRGQQAEVKWNLRLQQRNPKHQAAAVASKNNSAALSKALRITNGTSKRNDTGCQTNWLETSARASEGIRIQSCYALLVQRPRASIRWSGLPLRAATYTVAAPMRKLWLERLPFIPALEKICRSQSVRIEQDSGWPFASSNKGPATFPRKER